MKTRVILLLIGGLTVAATARAVPRPFTVNRFSGSLHVFQDLPANCDSISLDVPLVQGRLEIGPGDDPLWQNGQRLFMLLRGGFSFAPFSVHRSCIGRDETRSYTEVNVEVSESLIARGVPVGPDSQRYEVRIPKAQVRIRQVAMVNGAPETGELHPVEDVTGTIDLQTGEVTLGVKVGTRIHVTGFGDYNGSLTATLAGKIVIVDDDGDGTPNLLDTCPRVANPGNGPVASPALRGDQDIVVGTCKPPAEGLVQAVDRCYDGPVTIKPGPTLSLRRGLNRVTWEARDRQGRQATLLRNVWVDDKTAPLVGMPLPILLFGCGPATLRPPAAVDDCSGAMTMTSDAPPTFDGGGTIVTWTVRDVAGNTSRARQIVSVADSAPPAVSCARESSSEDRYVVTASDAPCTVAPTIRLGSYQLQNGERIRLLRSPWFSGVHLISDTNNLKTFTVGPGDDSLLAVDPAGNASYDRCAPGSGLPF